MALAQSARVRSTGCTLLGLSEPSDESFDRMVIQHYPAGLDLEWKGDIALVLPAAERVQLDDVEYVGWPSR